MLENKKLTKKLLLNQICDTCFYFATSKKFHCYRNGMVMKKPKINTCQHWRENNRL